MIKITIALMLGLMIGALCRWFDIPVPAPPQLLGVLLIASITIGYLVTDRFITKRATSSSETRINVESKSSEQKAEKGEFRFTF